MSAFLVLLFGAVVVVAGLFTVTRRNPIHAALCMLVALAGVAGLMLGLQAHFLAAMQVLLYGGAIMVLFVFVIMLLTLKDDELGGEPSQGQKVLAALGSIVFLFIIAGALSARRDAAYHMPYPEQVVRAAQAEGVEVRAGATSFFGSTEHFARFLYTDYAVAFELITVLVLASAAGVIVLARRPDKHTLEGTRLTGGHRS